VAGILLAPDSLGHAVGDELLLSIGGRLRTCLRTSDTLARLGGDEFAVLAEDLADLTQATALAQRMLNSLVPSVSIAGHELATTASIGIAMVTSEHEAPGDYHGQGTAFSLAVPDQARALLVSSKHTSLWAVPAPAS
jgi:diguanylate cyclase (GGDEF)-like protein